MPFPEIIAPLRNMRSTILIASIDNVREAGWYDAYVSRLPAAHHAPLLEAISGTWIPEEVALAHYAAIDALGLGPDAQYRLGRRTVERVGATFTGTAIRLTKQAGATPWRLFSLAHRFWSRGFDGGGVAIYRLGPKEARADLVSASVCASPFFRRALRAWVASFVEMFCERVYAHELPGPAGPHSMALRVQWV